MIGPFRDFPSRLARIPVGKATLGSLALPALTTGVLALASQWQDFRGWNPGYESAFKDFLLTHSFEPRSDDPLIAVVDIDDAAYAECFDPPNRLAPDTVKEMLDLLVEARGSEKTVFAVDLLTDAKRYSHLNRPDAVVLASGEKPRYLGAEQFWDWLRGAEYEYFVRPTDIWGQKFEEQKGKVSWGVPSYPTESDGVVRRLPASIRLTSDSTKGPIFATVVAETYAREADAGSLPQSDEDVHIMFDGWWPKENQKTFSAAKLFACSNSSVDSFTEEGRRDFASYGQANGKPVIVLVGATYATEDFYQTPAGRMSGLVLNAHAIRSVLTGNGVVELPPFLALVVQWAGAFVIFAVPLYVCGTRISPMKRRTERRVIAAVIFSFVLLGFVLHSATMMWPGLLAVIMEIAADLKKASEKSD